LNLKGTFKYVSDRQNCEEWVGEAVGELEKLTLFARYGVENREAMKKEEGIRALSHGSGPDVARCQRMIGRIDEARAIFRDHKAKIAREDEASAKRLKAAEEEVLKTKLPAPVTTTHILMLWGHDGEVPVNYSGCPAATAAPKTAAARKAAQRRRKRAAEAAAVEEEEEEEDDEDDGQNVPSIIEKAMAKSKAPAAKKRKQEKKQAREEPSLDVQPLTMIMPTGIPLQTDDSFNLDDFAPVGGDDAGVSPQASPVDESLTREVPVVDAEEGDVLERTGEGTSRSEGVFEIPNPQPQANVQEETVRTEATVGDDAAIHAEMVAALERVTSFSYVACFFYHSLYFF
jgi:hypothetical protein